jgi:hypothetical protein
MRVALFTLLTVLLFFAPAAPARPAATSSSALLSRIGGQTHAVAVQGSHVFLAEAAGISVLDVSDPAAPALVARLEVGRPITELAATEGALFLGTASGLLTVDIANPFLPALRGAYGTFAVSELALSGGRLYVAANEDGLHILDVSSPHSPAPLGRLTDHKAYAVTVAGTTAFTLSWVDLIQHLSSIDVADPGRPALLGTVNHGGTALAVAGNHLLVGVGEAPFFYNAYVTAFDISDPRQLRQGGRAYTSGDPSAIVAVGERFVAAMWNRRVESNQTGAVESFAVGQDGAVTKTDTQTTPRPAVSLAVAGGRVFLIADILRGYALGADGSLTPAGGYAVEPVAPQDVAVVGETALVIDSSALRAYNVADPAAPVLQSTTAITASTMSRMVVGDGVAFVYDGRVTAFDLSTPAAPALLGSVNLEALGGFTYPIGMAARGRLLFVNYGTTLQIVDASGPGAPIVRGTVAQEFHSFTGVALAGQYAYTVLPTLSWASDDTPLYKGRVCTYDVSDPDAPADLGCQESDGRGAAIVAGDQHLYTYGGDEIKIYSLANPQAPALIRSVGLPAIPGGNLRLYYDPLDDLSLAFDGSYLYAGSQGKIFVLDTAGPAAPRLLGTVATPGVPRRLQPAGELLYVVDSVGGVRALRVAAATLAPPVYLPLIRR